MSIDHMLDGADPRTAAEATLVLAEATVDDSGATDHERADARELIDLGVDELTARFTPEVAEDRSAPSSCAFVPSLTVFRDIDPVALASSVHGLDLGRVEEFYRAAEHSAATDVHASASRFWPRLSDSLPRDLDEASDRAVRARASDDADSTAGRDRD